MTYADPPSKKTQTDAMRELRLRMLTDPPAGFGVHPSKEFPRTYGVLMDWPIGENTITVVSLCTGDASLYTTSTFGVIGGIAHEAVRKAAAAFVSIADRFHEDSVPTADFPYPLSGRVRFYLVTFDGVRVIDTDLSSMETMKNKYFQAFEAGQAVLTELRLITEKKQ